MSDAPPCWVQDSVFYQIFVDRFARAGTDQPELPYEAWDAPPSAHGLKGGDLDGIRERLDHLDSLGVDTLLLTPIFSSPANHRYHTHDYRQVDPVLGGDAAFERLLWACRERSMRVVLDAVFNHSGRSFLPFADVLQNGPRSVYRDWFHIERFPLHAYDEGAPGFRCWRGIAELPQLDTRHPPVREFLMDVAEHWAARGIHGWRFDAPTLIEAEGFWAELRERLGRIDPELYRLGEIWTDAHEWAGPGRAFDGVTNYWLGGAALVYASGGRFRFDLIAESEYPLFREPLDASAFADAVDAILARYPAPTARAHLTVFSSHDTPRARTLAGDATAVGLAYLLAFTLPGAPCVYYGDEIGLTGGHDPECRAAFPWGSPERWHGPTLEHVRALAALRRERAALRRGSYRRVSTEGDVYAFLRELPEGSLLVAINATDGSASTAVHVRGARCFGSGELVEGHVSLPGRAGGVWVIER